MSTPTPDYGEPWKTRKGFDNDTIEIYAPNPRIEKPFQPCSLAVVESPLKGVSTKRLAERIKDCCNALAGVQDPAAHLANLNATIEQQAETLQSAIELIRRVSTGPATPNDAWQWLKQRGLDKYQHVNPDRKSHDQHA